MIARKFLSSFGTKKMLPIIIVTFLIIIGTYLFTIYFLMWLRPCESVLAQTTVQLGGNLGVAKTKGELVIGRQAVQEITDQVQGIALNLKTCCILLHDDKVTSTEFLRCQRTANDYVGRLDNVENLVEQASLAKQEGQAEKFAEIQEKLKASVKTLTERSEELTSMVSRFRNRHLPIPPDEFSQESPFPGVVATLTRLSDTGGMLTLEVIFENVGQEPSSFCVSPRDSHLLDETTGVKWEPADFNGSISCRFGGEEFPPGHTHLI